MSDQQQRHTLYLSPTFWHFTQSFMDAVVTWYLQNGTMPTDSRAQSEHERLAYCALRNLMSDNPGVFNLTERLDAIARIERRTELARLEATWPLLTDSQQERILVAARQIINAGEPAPPDQP